MKDILVDQEGDLRCPECHGKNFDHKRSLKAKVTLGVVILPAALLAKKRMKCLNCGAYSKTGNAQQWRDPKLDPALPSQPAPVDLAAPTDGSAVTVRVTGSRTTGPALASYLREVLPSLHVDRRQRFAESIRTGVPVDVASVAPGAASALVERFRALGITAEVVPPPS